MSFRCCFTIDCDEEPSLTVEYFKFINDTVSNLMKLAVQKIYINKFLKTDHGCHGRMRGDQHGPDHLVSSPNL